ncbi:MAG: S8 family peptidase [Candidatus Kapaibacterium sp.]
MMQRFLCTFFILTALGSLPLISQDFPWRVLLKDKGPEKFSIGTPLYQSTLLLHSDRSIQRRLKVRKEAELFTIEDAPIYAPYIQQITSLKGVQKLLEIRWQNYIVIRCDSATAQTVGALQFVKKIERTSVRFSPRSTAGTYTTFPLAPTNFPSIVSQENCGSIRYGTSFNQLEMLGIPEFHALGMMGQNTLTAFFDTGFRWKSHVSLTAAQIVDEYDFIQNDSITANQENDVPAQDDHGSIVLSTVAGFQQDSLIGAAPFASFLLAKTEDLPTETRLEEENYAAAVEWAELRGADIISSSLGYSRMDNTDESYTYEDMNGSLPIVSRAVNDAVKRGVLCLTAAGNSGAGERDSTIGSPGDADSVITVAGVIPNGVNVVGFSSRGPTASKVPKPDLAAQASEVVMMRTGESSGIRRGAGTSFATPLTAGFATLLLSQFPEIAPWEAKKAMFASAEKHDSIPHKVLGYGVPKLKKAMLALGPVISHISSYPVGNYMRIVAAVMSQSPLISVELSIVFADETMEKSITMLPSDKLPFYAVDIPLQLFKGKNAGAYIKAKDNSKSRNFPCNYAGEPLFHIIEVDQENILCGISKESLPNKVVIASVESEDSKEIIELHGDMLSVSSKPTLTPVDCAIYDILGNIVYQSAMQNTGNFVIQLGTLQLPHGTYIVTVRDQFSHKSKIIFR